MQNKKYELVIPPVACREKVKSVILLSSLSLLMANAVVSQPVPFLVIIPTEVPDKDFVAFFYFFVFAVM